MERSHLIYQEVDILAMYTFLTLSSNPAMSIVFKFLCENVFSFHLDIFICIGLYIEHIGDLLNCFQKQLYQFAILLALCKDFNIFIFSKFVAYCYFFPFSDLSMCEVVVWL